MDLVIFASATDLGRSVAQDIRDGLTEASHRGRTWTLGLPSGRTCIPVLEELERIEDVEWGSLRLLMPDTYCTKTDGRYQRCSDTSPESVFCFIQRYLPSFWDAVSRGPMTERILVPNPNSLGSLRSVLGHREVDLMLLASGSSDGHVAFNSPGADIGSSVRIATLPLSTRQDNLKTYPHFGSIDCVPEYGVTIGIEDIVSWSRRAVMILWGVEKRSAFERIATATGYDPSWPASVIHECAQARIYCDMEARWG